MPIGISGTNHVAKLTLADSPSISGSLFALIARKNSIPKIINKLPAITKGRFLKELMLNQFRISLKEPGKAFKIVLHSQDSLI
jgi:hypothetical protein